VVVLEIHLLERRSHEPQVSSVVVDVVDRAELAEVRPSIAVVVGQQAL